MAEAKSHYGARQSNDAKHFAMIVGGSALWRGFVAGM